MNVDHGHRRIDRDFHLPTELCNGHRQAAENRGLLLDLAVGIDREARRGPRISARLIHAEAKRNRAPV